MFTVPVVPLSLSSLLIIQIDIQYQQCETYSAELHFVSEVNQKCNINLKINISRSVLQFVVLMSFY